MYFFYLFKDISSLSDYVHYISLFISVLLGKYVFSYKTFHLQVIKFAQYFQGVSNAVLIQVRCILCLLLPMYCGKSGRGVLKAVVLSYVVAGPIRNMGLNAKEVVRVFACSKELSFNLSKIRHNQLYRPLNRALLSFKKEIEDIKDAMSSIREVVFPIEYEIEGMAYLDLMEADVKFTNALFNYSSHVNNSRTSYTIINESESKRNQDKYVKKMYYRCENQLSHAISMCLKMFSSVRDACLESLPQSTVMVCWSLMLPRACDLKQRLGDLCNAKREIDPGLGEGYTHLKKAEGYLNHDLQNIHLQTKVTYIRDLCDIQDAKETGDRVLHAFKEKYVAIESLIIIVNFCLALLFLRILIAAYSYHELYLTAIDFDNVYITSYFKKIDKKREKKEELYLLPLNKMERNRYIDAYSTSYLQEERSKLLTQILKVMLEAITATTFVMLDRLFFEAMDVVRQHAMEKYLINVEDIQIKIKGTGILSNMMKKILDEIGLIKNIQMTSKDICIPHPRSMPPIYYVKIYAGYLWILLLLYINPYTLRLRRLICGYFYPERERRRILHLYNDILKKRTKIQKTLRRKAVQTVRAHYLSGENLLSLRIRYPNLLGWLVVFPAARMKCLICEETQPRSCEVKSQWQKCNNPLCPFVLCGECTADAGGCLACDPALALLSDIDSLSDEPPRRY
ncbi:hypothetical protein KGM_210470 [Danaus plexippus plexippus]|uniref:Dendritic cell-specific transmembrane protein-like domain-containing protein n=1 Tax=Danaus plexippus plexippus TaxID=278856 RepID=A0A212FET7_DANPL|nr:hypothetical protein KGM_210470 [Danaus plexippus plexippus]